MEEAFIINGSLHTKTGTFRKNEDKRMSMKTGIKGSAEGASVINVW